MTLYFYADETIFELDNNDGIPINIYGYGVLITREPVEERDVIVEALNDLRQDPDIHKEKFRKADYRTLDRGYFHACEDSQNAHSHLCTAIRKHIQGKFRYDYDDQSKFSDILTLACLELNYRNEPIIITIEERNDFQESNIDIWKNKTYRDIEESIVKTPNIPAYFPEITTKVMNKEKKNAGLQVCDFILWAINRTKQKNPDTKWYDRLEFISHSSFRIANQLYTGGECILQKDLDYKFSYPCFPLKELPNNFLDLMELYLFIEHQLLKTYCSSIPKHILHLQDKLSKVVRNLDFYKKVNLEHKKIIQEISSIYIRLFDTLPLYQGLPETDHNQWSKFLLSRKFASQLLFEEDPEVQRFYYELVKYKCRSYLGS